MLDDRYEFKRSLGTGGMAGVFLAHDKNLDRLVAIKRIHADLSDQSAVVARFQREARIIARVRHPHIVDIFDVVADEQNNVAMVMEFVDGIDLTAITRHKPALPMAPELAISIVRPIASALAHAHDSGVVHRDIKPANILMGLDGAVKLTDFGIARGDEDAALTRPGDFLGTPAYVPPEQARGKPVGPAADQYALGVVLYQLMTGIKPFAARSTGDVLVRIIRGDFTDPKTICKAIDTRLAGLLSRMMAVNPEDRFADMEATLEAFDSISSQVSGKELRRRVSALCEKPAEAVGHWGYQIASTFAVRATQAKEAGDLESAVRDALAALARSPEHPEARAILETCGGSQDHGASVELEDNDSDAENGATIVSPMTFEQLVASEEWKGASAKVAGAGPGQGETTPDATPASNQKPVSVKEKGAGRPSPPPPPPPALSLPSGEGGPTVPETPTPAQQPTVVVAPNPVAAHSVNDEVTQSRATPSFSNLRTALLFLLVALVFGGGTWVVLELTRQKTPQVSPSPTKKLVIGQARKTAYTVRLYVVDEEAKGVPKVALSLGQTSMGETNADGRLEISHHFRQGQQVQFRLTLPDGFAPLSKQASSALTFVAQKGHSDAKPHEIMITLDRPKKSP